MVIFMTFPSLEIRIHWFFQVFHDWSLHIRSLHTSPWKREVRTLTAVEWTALEVQRFSSAFTNPFLTGTKSTEILCRFRDHIGKDLKYHTADCKEEKKKTSGINYQIISMIFSHTGDMWLHILTPVIFLSISSDHIEFALQISIKETQNLWFNCPKSYRL